MIEVDTSLHFWLSNLMLKMILFVFVLSFVWFCIFISHITCFIHTEIHTVTLKLHKLMSDLLLIGLPYFGFPRGGLTLFWLCPFPLHNWVALFWLSQEGAYLILAMPFPPSHSQLTHGMLFLAPRICGVYLLLVVAAVKVTSAPPSPPIASAPPAHHL